MKTRSRTTRTLLPGCLQLNVIMPLLLLLLMIPFTGSVNAQSIPGTDPTSQSQTQINQGEEDQPMTFRDLTLTRAPEAIPLDKYSAGIQHMTTLVISLPAGTYEVGDDQPVLKKLTDVAAQLNGATITGDIIYELNATYDGTIGETFPIVFQPFTSSGGTWTVTIRVKTGVGLRNTTGNTDNPLIVFNGADNLFLDGRAGGTGTSIDWNLYNSGTNGTVALFINDAKSNTIQYCDMVSLHKTQGVVTFGSTLETDGNDDNTIAYCNIHDDGTNSPGYGIYSLGNLSDIAAYNSGNKVQNCNIYNMFNDGSLSESIYLANGSTGWTISGNSFYQTITRTPAGAFTNFNMIDICSGDSYTVTGNYIGGSAPLCGGSKWVIDGTNTTKTFYGIAFTGVIGDNPNLIDGNTITNISFKYNITSYSYLSLVVFSGILVGDGIHDITNNVIGSGTGTGAIYIQTGPSMGGSVNALFYQYGQGGLITNNTLGGFTFDAYPDVALGSPSPADLYLIRLNQVNNTVPLNVSNNLVGSLTTPGSVTGTVLTGAPGYIRINALNISTSTGQTSMTVMNNTAANIVANSVSTKSFVKGIIIGSYYNGSIISGNVVRNLTNNAPNNSTVLGSCAMLGLQFLIYAPATISQNSAYDLYLTNTTAATVMAGIFVQNGPTAGYATFERNFVHNLSNLSTSTSAVIYGINVATGNSLLRNNMVSLGAKPDGSAITTGCQLTGILDVNGNNSYYNNSVYLGGSVASGATGNTACFNSSATTSVRKVIGNIFFNARSGGTTGKHYAIRFTNVNPAIVTSNNNLLLASGAVGGTLGYYVTNLSTLDAWKGATGLDMASGTGNPNFINPLGSTALTDLHVQGLTPVESGGVALADVTTDFDGDLRSGLTPADIGADAGNFTSSGDIFGPTISYSQLLNSTTSNRVLTNIAVISDNIAVAGGVNGPRFYFKRSTDANVFAGNTSADNGWKYVPATNTTSPYSFVVDYSLLFGGSVASGDIIQYFVAAQDESNNMNSLPMAAVAGGIPPIQNITAAPAVPNQYIATDVMISGTISIPGTYPTLTGNGGLFQMINNSLVNGNIVVNITGNLTEPGTYALNQFSTIPENTSYTLLIQPDAASERVISGAVADGMIRFNGADGITIEGNYEGSGRYLRFINTNTANPTITIQNDADYISLKHLVIEGANSTATSGVLFIGGSNYATGNNNLTFSGNILRNLSTGSGIPNTLIHSTGTVFRENSNVTIADNELFNFSSNGINITSSANGNNWTITGNNVYCALATAPTTAQTGINFVPGNSSSGNTVSNNFVGGTAPACGGTPWINASTSGSFYGINITIGSELLNTIDNNLIRNISLTGTGSTAFYGLFISGDAWISCNGNVVGGSTGTPSITKVSTGALYGQDFACQFNKVSEIHNNIVGDMYSSGVGLYSTMPMFVMGKVNFTQNTVGNLDIPASIVTNGYLSIITASVTTYGISANIEGTFSHNTVAGVIQASTRPGTFCALSFTNALPKVIDANLVMNCGPTAASTDTTDVIGLSCSLSGNATARLQNNVINLGEGISNSHVYKGILDAGTVGNTEIMNNTVRLGGSCTGNFHSYAYIKNGAGTTVQKNNLYANFRTGSGKHYSAGVVTLPTLFTSDYNDYYSLTAPQFIWGTTEYSSLTDWQTASINDENSVSADPLFHSATDLRVCSPELEDAGIAVDGVQTDYAMVIRSNPPDIGAYEFTLPVVSITTGNPDFCNGEWLNANSSTTATMYEWSTGESTQSIFLNIVDNPVGIYSVYITDQDGCKSAMPAEYLYQPEQLISSYTLLGFEETQVGEYNTVLNGSVGLTGIGLMAHVKKYAQVNGMGSFVKADLINAHPTATIRKKVLDPATVSLPAMQYNTVNGTYSNVNVPDNTTITLTDNYLNLKIGKNCLVTLTGNIFGSIQICKGSVLNFASPALDIVSLKSFAGDAGSPVTIAFAGEASVRVKNSIDLETYCTVNPDGYPVVFYIGSEGVTGGQLKVKAAGAIFNGSALVPSGQIQVITEGLTSSPARMTGKFIAAKILSNGKNVIWNWRDCNDPGSPALMNPGNIATGIEPNAEAAAINVYPIPNNGLFRISISVPAEEIFTIGVYNAMGLLLKEISGVDVSGSAVSTIDLRPAVPGIYTVVVWNEHTRFVRKVVVN